MIQKLRETNEKIIKFNCSNNIDNRKYILIQKILEDEKCFLKMNIEQAYAIFRDLQLKESDFKDIYNSLTNV